MSCCDPNQDSLEQPHKADLDSLICYCFGFSIGEILDAKRGPEIVAEITRRTADKECACEIKNPQGRCCLGAIQALLKSAE